jgi:glucose dehydrogenase
LVGLELEDRRRTDLGDGSLRRGFQLALLGARKSLAGFCRRESLGDNLYSDSLLALDADSGKLKWHFQFTPHDVLDMDSNQVPVLVDAEFHGRPRKLVLLANRNGFYYVLDRLSGEFLVGKRFARQTWRSAWMLTEDRS